MSDALDRLNNILQRETRKRNLESRGLRLGARNEQRRYIQSRDEEIAEAARRRDRLAVALRTDGQDALRFRWFFEKLPQAVPSHLRGKSLDEIRRWIDEKIIHATST